MTIPHFSQQILDSLPPLTKGRHSNTAKAVCAMEALARACGYGTTDHPECASPVIGAFCRALNDELPTDDLRDKLIRPILPLMVGTADDGHDLERAYLCADRAVRVFAPIALEAAGQHAEAKTLRMLEPVHDQQSAWSAALAAARAAESEAVWAAESEAVWAARAATESTLASTEWAARAGTWMVRSATWTACHEEAAETLRDLCQIINRKHTQPGS